MQTWQRKLKQLNLIMNTVEYKVCALLFAVDVDWTSCLKRDDLSMFSIKLCSFFKIIDYENMNHNILNIIKILNTFSKTHISQ